MMIARHETRLAAALLFGALCLAPISLTAADQETKKGKARTMSDENAKPPATAPLKAATAPLSAATPPSQAGTLLVRAKVTRSDWKEYPTRLLRSLEGYAPAAQAPQMSQYGGWMARKAEATGFFHAKQLDGRWWLIDPEGCAFISQGIVSVTAGSSTNNEEALKARFGTKDAWATATVALLRDNGFNGTGAWADDARLAHCPQRIAYCPIWNFMSSYGKKRGGTYQQPGHTGYPKDAIFVFDPEFEQFADEHARQLAATKDDPWVLGHFSDNELPFPKDSLDKYLSLPQTDPGYMAAAKWLAQEKGAAADPKNATDEDRDRFRAFVVERYFAIVGTAIKRHDPNHVLLGSRLHGSEKGNPAVLRAAGKYLDAVAINLYHEWTPKAGTLRQWGEWAGKPILITEWYARANDTGMANTSGAGWTVATQQERGYFYQNFTLALLESRVCVGWHWFKYMDNDPENLKTDPSNRDSNKGIVSIRYEPYTPLLQAMKELNANVYPVIEYFDRRP